MAQELSTKPEDRVVVFTGDEYSALLSLLYELQDEEKIATIAHENKISLTNPQMNRIARMWSDLAQRPGR